MLCCTDCVEDPEYERDVRERFRPRPEPVVLSAAFELGFEPFGLTMLLLRSPRGRGFDSPLVFILRLARTGMRLTEPAIELCADVLRPLLVGRDP